MNEEDFACDKFVGQRWRKDVCKNCFQPKRLHELRTKKSKADDEITALKSTVASTTLTSMISADTETTDKTDSVASTQHIEHEQQQNEVNLQTKVAVVMSDEQLSASTQESRAIEQKCSLSDVEREESDSKVPVDVNTGEQATVDDLCADSNTNVIIVKYDKETEQSSNDDTLDKGDKRNDNDRSEYTVQKTPLDNSDVSVRDTSLCNTTTSLDEGIKGNSEETRDDVTDSETIKHDSSFPSLVEHSNIFHEELPTKSSSGDEDIHKEVTGSVVPLFAVNTGEELSCSQDVPDESGFEGDTMATQVKDDQPITSNIVTSTVLSSSLQDDAVHSLSAVELPQQLSMEETHTNVVCDESTKSPSAKVELPQSNDDKNHPAPPSLAAADNQAPPMIVNDQGISIPAPPSPPPIRPPPPSPSLTAGKQPSADPPGADPTAEVLMSPQASFYVICKVIYVTIKYCNRFVWQLILSCFLCGQTAVCYCLQYKHP